MSVGKIQILDRLVSTHCIGLQTEESTINNGRESAVNRALDVSTHPNSIKIPKLDKNQSQLKASVFLSLQKILSC
jgi:hypothetical protein